MAISVQTSFTLKVADKGKPKVVGDQQVASILSGSQFYSISYIVDTVGTFLGEINDFLAVQCKSPLLIEFQRVDMKVTNQIYCESLFINHGNLGSVWLRIPPSAKASIATVWYSSNSPILELNEYIQVKRSGDIDKKFKQLQLRNLNGVSLGIPLFYPPNTFKSLDKVNKQITAITHRGIIKNLPVQVTEKGDTNVS